VQFRFLTSHGKSVATASLPSLSEKQESDDCHRAMGPITTAAIHALFEDGGGLGGDELIDADEVADEDEDWVEDVDEEVLEEVPEEVC